MRNVFACIALLLFSGAAFGQNTGDANKVKTVTPQYCVILKEMGPADQITSHLYSFGFRGKQFQYLEGTLPPRVKFHGRLTDHDVRKILDNGGQVRIVQSKYTAQEVQDARRACSDPSMNPK
ncbi:MAG: hypothetical protein WBA09_22265 [Candidatus Acidiferrum sp.]